jgi:hypothetical protein
MAKPARKASPKDVARKVSSSTVAHGKGSAYVRIRHRVENMYLLHMLLLVIMSALGAALFVITVNQKIKIQSLEFQLDFVSERYEILRQADQQRRVARDLETAEPTPSPVTRPVNLAR